LECNNFEDRIKLYNGDCLEVMKDIQDKSIDMILCDLPYGTTACKWDAVIPFEPLWEQYNRIIKDNGAIALFGSEPFSSALRMSNIKHYKYDWVWDKVKPNGHLVAKYRPMQRNENISVFGKNKINYYPIMIDRKRPTKSKEYSRTEIMGGTTTDNNGKVLNKKYPQNILVYSNASQKNKLHPTQKPVALLEYLIKTYTNDGDTVLDNCMGSGSTGVACVNTKRKFIGIELDNTYYKVAKDRIKQAFDVDFKTKA
jgi:site-specific DNA-methyltransferase (adenine-specific)